LGAFTVVTFYSHGIVSFGVLVATTVTTSGDEALCYASSHSKNSNTDNKHPIFGSSIAGLLYRLPTLKAGFSAKVGYSILTYA